MIRLTLLLLILAAPARADFVVNNLRFTLYHEAAHAVIDQRDLSLTGPEENAADGFAMVLADRLHDEATMQTLITDVVALGRHDALSELFDPWSQYMPGNQRLSWALCLYYGLSPATRGDYARALGMPADRADRCEEAASRTRKFWTPILASSRPTDGRISFQAGRVGKSLRLLEDDLARLNAALALPRPIPVLSQDCGEDNAFYYHADARIVICTEMVTALRSARR